MIFSDVFSDTFSDVFALDGIITRHRPADNQLNNLRHLLQNLRRDGIRVARNSCCCLLDDCFNLRKIQQQDIRQTEEQITSYQCHPKPDLSAEGSLFRKDLSVHTVQIQYLRSLSDVRDDTERYTQNGTLYPY